MQLFHKIKKKFFSVISRVPDNEELKNFRELPSSDDIAKKQSIKKKPASDADII